MPSYCQHPKSHEREGFYRFCEPPRSVSLEPAQMTTQGRRAQYSISSLLDLFVRQGFASGNLIHDFNVKSHHGLLATYRVILGIDGEQGYSDSEKGVGGRGVTIVSTFGRITPSWALQFSVSCQLRRRHSGKRKMHLSNSCRYLILRTFVRSMRGFLDI